MNFTCLKDISDNHPLVFYEYELPYTELILEMYNNPNIKPEDYDLENNVILNLIGQYYHHIFTNKVIKRYYFSRFYYRAKDYDKMKKYYLMAIEKDYGPSMHNLACYYYSVEKNYELMKKYYLMAIKKDHVSSMNNLGYYYKNSLEKDYELMKKYFLMAIEKGNVNSMNNLAMYYYSKQNYELMKKYFLMAIERNHLISMDYLKKYYFDNEKYNTLKYYNFLYNLQPKSDIVIKTMNNLYLDDNKIIEYQNKININQNNIKECIICFELVIHIPLDCKHEVCINCYCFVDKCFYRCY
jgi:tetratricopeptide (TPR) repeat protein